MLRTHPSHVFARFGTLNFHASARASTRTHAHPRALTRTHAPTHPGGTGLLQEGQLVGLGQRNRGTATTAARAAEKQGNEKSQSDSNLSINSRTGAVARRRPRVDSIGRRPRAHSLQPDAFLPVNEDEGLLSAASKGDKQNKDCSKRKSMS
jgi:hypothetical protein